MYRQSHRDYLALVICIIVCLSWAVNHYRDNASTKPSATKNARELNRRTRQLLTCNPLAWWRCARCKIHEGLADAKAESPVLCVMMLPLVVVGCTSKQSVSQCVKPPPPPAWIMQPPRPDRHRWTGLFTLRERLITMQKQLEGQKYINEQCGIELPISMGSSYNYCEQYTPSGYKCLNK